MASFRDIKRTIKAVEKTEQITKAMNMVAAAKLKSAQLKLENFRPYAEKFMDVLNSVALLVDPDMHPLLAVRKPKRVGIICMTSDRGLCGGFNSNIVRAVEEFIRYRTEEKDQEVFMVAVGRKGRDHFKKTANVVAHHTNVFNQFDISLASNIGDALNSSFTNKEYDELYVAYNVFHSLSIQKPNIERLLPVGSVDSIKELEPERKIEYIYEPSEEVLINKLLPSYLRIMIFRALLETSAGENGARMVAMDNATNNCEDMVKDLSLKYNKARQQAITAELMDIVGGTEALAKG